MNTNLTVRVYGPGELLASIPALLGVQPPVGSLVLISLTNGTIGRVVRADLPAAGEYGYLVRQAVTPTVVAEGTEVVAVVIDDNPHPGLLDELQRADITLAGAYTVPAITAGNPTRSTGTPSFDRCNTVCANVARTDTHIDRARREAAELQNEIDSGLHPHPIQQRHQQRRQVLLEIIDRHERSKPDPDQSPEPPQ